MAQKEFRKPPRYMVGDIVFSHGFICVVCSVYPFNIDYSYDLKVISGKSLGKICQEDIMHVHIWEEFLKKNGWEKEKYGLSYYKKESSTLEFRLICKTYGWTLRCGNKDLIEKVEFVNQLQHFLFGLGINHEMEV